MSSLRQALQLDFFPLPVQLATGERYAFHLLSYQRFLRWDPIETVDNPDQLEIVSLTRVW